jgi:nucleotide-binding universal stress UspA family protein
MKKLLVPLDGSESALKALQFAIDRARESGAEIHILHVEPPLAYEELQSYALRDELQEARRQACQRVLDSAAIVLRQNKVAHAEHLRQGAVGESIAKFTASEHMDEIVMGTRGLGAVGGLLLGSVSNRVVHLVHVPVTLVK